MPKNKFIFLLIIILTVSTRFYRLADFPVSLNWDEISHGYNSYSVLKTGRDQWGQLLPVFNFRAYGDYPTTLYMYLTIPFVYLFGLNAFSIRLPSAILGTISVLFSFIFGQKFLKKNSYSLLLAFLCSISPWLFFTSRGVFQSTISQSLFFIGIALLYSSLSSKKLSLAGCVLLGLSSYAYHNTRLIALPIFFIFIYIFKSQINFFKSKLAIITFLFFAIPATLSMLTSESRARSPWVSIIDQGAINYLNEKIGQFSLGSAAGRLVYNKATYFSAYFINNLIDSFNPVKLFFIGTKQFQFNVPYFGILLFVWLPFFYIGFLSVINSAAIKKQKSYLFILCWLFLGLIPSAITKGDFPVLRLMPILPLPQLFTVIGFFSVANKFRKFLYLILILFIISSLMAYTSYLRKYYVNYPINYSFAWQYGYREAVNLAKTNYNRYDQIIFTKKYGEPHEFVLFYWPWDPLSYQSDPNKIWDYHTNWYWVDAFDKFKFINDWEIIAKTQTSTTNTLLITSPGNYPPTANFITRISFLDKSPAFDIVSLNHEN